MQSDERCEKCGHLADQKFAGICEFRGERAGVHSCACVGPDFCDFTPKAPEVCVWEYGTLSIRCIIEHKHTPKAPEVETKEATFEEWFGPATPAEPNGSPEPPTEYETTRCEWPGCDQRKDNHGYCRAYDCHPFTNSPEKPDSSPCCDLCRLNNTPAEPEEMKFEEWWEHEGKPMWMNPDYETIDTARAAYEAGRRSR